MNINLENKKEKKEKKDGNFGKKLKLYILKRI